MAKPAKAKPEGQSKQLQDYLACMATYDREFRKWETRVERILKRYRDEDRPSNKAALCRFNILWSNVQTLVPACFSKLPKPDVSRRFKDQDPVGRVAALLLERGLEFEIDHYEDYRSTMRQCVYDRFLGGRGSAWVRYEPHFKAEGDEPEDGSQITEDTDEAPVDEAIDYECAPIDYVHWKDYGHDVARTWEEVTRVWRKVYMSEEAVSTRFGAEIAKKIPYDASPEELKRSGGYKGGDEGVKKQACIIEFWDKQRGVAVWFSKGMPDVLDEREDPLGLQNFFPCPKPLFATLTNESLVPVPDFSLYQDQAKELDTLSDRIDGLVQMLQVKGVYDASADGSLARLFTEGENGTLLPVKNWAQFAEKNGLKGQVDVMDLTMIAKALEMAAVTMDQVKGQVYEITGISDIIRGQTQASETATAQQIKGQYASLRLRSMQDEVARFATECLQLKAQVICSHFSANTIAAISAADQLSDEDKAHVYTAPPQPQGQPAMMPGAPQAPQPEPQPTGPAMQLLIGQERIMDPQAESPNPMRSFRIEVATDTLVQLDETQEKQDRIEFVTAVGAYIEKAAPVIQMAPAAGPLVMTLLKFGVRAFKVGKQVEGQIDSAIDQMTQMAKAGPPPDPKAMQEQAMQQAKAQVTQENATKEIGLNKRAADLDIREMKFKLEQDLAKAKQQAEDAIRDQEMEHATRESKIREKEEQTNTKALQGEAEIAEKSASIEREATERSQSQAALNEETIAQLAHTATALAAAIEKMDSRLDKVEKLASAKKRIVRGPDGKAVGLEVEA